MDGLKIKICVIFSIITYQRKKLKAAFLKPTQKHYISLYSSSFTAKFQIRKLEQIFLYIFFFINPDRFAARLFS